jgi:hypothetical protein
LPARRRYHCFPICSAAAHDVPDYQLTRDNSSITWTSNHSLFRNRIRAKFHSSSNSNYITTEQFKVWRVRPGMALSRVSGVVKPSANPERNPCSYVCTHTERSEISSDNCQLEKPFTTPTLNPNNFFQLPQLNVIRDFSQPTFGAVATG